MAFVLDITDKDEPVDARAGGVKYSYLGSSGELPPTGSYTVTYGDKTIKLNIVADTATPPVLSVRTLTAPVALENASYSVDTGAKTMTRRTSGAPAQPGEVLPPALPDSDTASALVFGLLSGKLESVLAELDTRGEGDFAKGNPWREELDTYVGTFNIKQDIVYDNTPFPARNATTRTRIVGNRKTIAALQGDLAADTAAGKVLSFVGDEPIDGLPQAVQGMVADEDKTFRDFILAGREGTLGTADGKRMYDDLVGLFKIFGIPGKLDKIYDKIKEESAVAADKVGGAAAAAASGVAGVINRAAGGDSGETNSASTTTAASGAAATTTPTAAEPAPEADPGQTIGFFVTIFGAAPSTPARIQIEFDRGIGDNTADTYVIDPIQGTKFDKRLAVQVRKAELVEFWKANTGTDATVRITAVPASGGDAITVTQVIPIKWPLRTAEAMLPAEVFRFSETVGRRSYSGVPADEGRGGAKDDRDKQADVAQLYYTQSGGIRVSTTGARVDAVGRTYRFTFDPPMLVPVEIAVPEGKRLSERTALAEGAVPHWIFLAGRRGGGDGAPAGRGGSGGQALNIAVSGFGIKTTSKWIAVPNVGAVWDKDTFRVKIAPVAAGGPVDKSGLAPVLGVAEINKANLDMDAVERAVLEACFGSSAAWSKLGAANNCWAKDPSVTGPGGVTAREITYKVGGSA